VGTCKPVALLYETHDSTKKFGEPRVKLRNEPGETDCGGGQIRIWDLRIARWHEIRNGGIALQAAGFSECRPVSAVAGEFRGDRREAGKLSEGVAAGTTGAMIGGALVWLVGIGGLAIPGLGPFIVAGQIMAALAGAGASGAGGRFAGGLVSQGLAECRARRHETRLRHGEIMVGVSGETIEDVDRVKIVLNEMGAEEILATNERGSDDEHCAAVGGGMQRARRPCR
jgi:hypothetical protein